MKNFGVRFALIGGLTVAALICIWGKGLKLGIDLSGGTILVYQVNESGRGGDTTKMDDLITALKRRVNPEGLQDIPIRKVGNNRIEIILAEATPEQVDDLKRKLTEVGSLEFRILANERKDGARGTGAIARALAPSGLARPPKGYNWARLGETITGTPTKQTAREIIDTTKSWRSNRFSNPSWSEDPQEVTKTHITLTGRDASGRERTARFAIASNTRDTITLVKPHNMQTVTSYTIEYNPSGIQASPDAIVREQPAGSGRTERFLLYKEDRQNVTGELLSHAFATQDERIQPAVGFAFNAQGARRFGTLTREHSPEENGAFKYRLAIILDNLIMSAPSINSEIRESGVIEGVQPKEVSYLVEILRSGSLPTSVDPTPLLEDKIGPTLGKDTIDKGIRAIAISMLVVPLFMLVYYRFSGLVAVIALILNMIFLVASMAATDSSFTLPGLAGLALTIGMAVDANVLIFERMREEAERGAGLGQQIRNGFNRAWATILDSHLTLFLSGAVLYAIGTEEIKGFAVTLIIGMVWNLFTAVYISRIIFDFAYTSGWLKRLTMIKMLDKTNIDFIGPRRIFITVSSILIVLGLLAFFYDPSKPSHFNLAATRKLNIDFTGGTLITMQLDDNNPRIKNMSEGQRSAFVREQAGSIFRDVSVEMLNVGSERRGTRFNIRTTDSNSKEVQAKIIQKFGDTLARPEMTVSKPSPIADAKPAAEAKAETKTAAASARFPGGQRYALSFNREVAPETVRSAFAQILKESKVSNPETRFELAVPTDRPAPTATGGAAPTELVLSTDLEPATAGKYLDTLAKRLTSDTSLLFERVTNFGAAVASDQRVLAAMAIVASWLVIIGYLWFRFKSVSYGLAAVIALVHDVFITMGAVAISPYKIDLPMVAAFLTLIGFSVNDTIVIFDRIREIKGKTPILTSQMVNDAINQTLSRTILTSLTAWLVVVILYLFGGEGLHGFSFCLVVGFLSGTYSTVYIATPILVDWIGRHTDKPAADTSKSMAAAAKV